MIYDIDPDMKYKNHIFLPCVKLGSSIIFSQPNFFPVSNEIFGKISIKLENLYVGVIKTWIR